MSFHEESCTLRVLARYLLESYRMRKGDMSYDTRILDNRQVILQTCHSDYRSTEMTSLWAEARSKLDELDQPVYYVIDLEAVLTPASGVPSPESLEFYNPDVTLSHPNILEVVPVARNMSTIIEALGLHSVLIGDAIHQYFHTLDEALTYCGAQAEIEPALVGLFG
jgi:hypothetical protein